MNTVFSIHYTAYVYSMSTSSVYTTCNGGLLFDIDHVRCPTLCGQKDCLLVRVLQHRTRVNASALDSVTIKNICNCSHLICDEDTCSELKVIKQ